MKTCESCIREDCIYRSDLVIGCRRRVRRVTNADRIRSMTDDELAELLRKIRGGCRGLTTESYACDFYFYKEDFTEDCNSCWLDWLKQEAQEAQEAQE